MIKGKMVLLSYIDVPWRLDVPIESRGGLGWFVSVVRTIPAYAENPTAKFYRELDEMKRYNQEGQKKAGKWVPSKDKFLQGRPALDAMLTDAWWEDGKPREVCSLTIRVGSTQAMISLNDSDLEQSITTNAETVDEALDRLEAYLSAGNPSWRSWGKKKGR